MGSLAVVCALVVTGVCASGKCSAAAQSDPPIAAESGVELVEMAVSAFIHNITFSNEEIIVNGTNPESRALTWLIYGDDTFDSSDLLSLNLEAETEIRFRVLQRFVLAILWFQQVDESGAFINRWRNPSGWLDYSNECDWYGIDCESTDLGGNVGLQYAVTKIEFFDEVLIGGNNFIGTIPPDIGQLTLLTHLEFSFNPVVGTLPESIGQCSRLQYILFFDCSMNGTLPSSIGQLTEMEVFDVGLNNFIGTVPNSTAQWSNLTRFIIVNNRFTGPFPDFIGRLTMLNHMDFGVNAFTGTLSPSIGELTDLVSFLVHSNTLVGTIPSSIGNWSQIDFIFFQNNQLTGSIPEELCLYIDGTIDEIYVDCEVNCTCRTNSDDCG